MKKFVIKIQDGIHIKVKVNAAEMGITMSDYIVTAILEKLVNDEKKKATND